MSNGPKETLLKFPCDFPIKVFGLASDEFERSVLNIIQKYVPNISNQAIKSRKSDKGNYLALTIVVHVESKIQLDQIYQELSSSPKVLMAL